MKLSISYFIKLVFVIPLITSSIISCGGTSAENQAESQYVSVLEALIETQAETDNDKKQIMLIHEELGGSDASRQRADQACESLKTGMVVEDVSHEQSIQAIRDLGLTKLGRAWNSEESERIKYASNLYIAEVFAAQETICPETKVELEL